MKIKKIPVICNAKKRNGTPCKKKAMLGKKKCRLHGGLTPIKTGTRTMNPDAHPTLDNLYEKLRKFPELVQAENILLRLNSVAHLQWDRSQKGELRLHEAELLLSHCKLDYENLPTDELMLAIDRLTACIIRQERVNDNESALVNTLDKTCKHAAILEDLRLKKGILFDNRQITQFWLTAFDRLFNMLDSLSYIPDEKKPTLKENMLLVMQHVIPESDISPARIMMDEGLK